MREKIKLFVFVLLGALCLLSDAFINGFPIVYPDTSTYLASGMQFETPFDRPITYGLFIRIFSLNGLSLWGVVLFQALILSFLIFLLIRMIIVKKSFLKYGLFTILFLSLATGLSWTVSQLMPDIFTSVGILCMVLILSGKFTQRIMFLLFGLFFVSVAMHMSHILLFGLMLGVIFSFRKFLLPKQTHPKRNFQIGIMFLLTLVSVVTMGSSISKSKHVFFMGAMAESGILKEYLDDFCDTRHYRLCAYKDSLPDKAYKFVWDEKSPFYKIGGWKESKGEFNEIIYGTLTQPKFIGMHIKESMKATLRQLTLFKIGDGNESYPEGTVMHERISLYFPIDQNAFTAARQNQSQLGFVNFFNNLFSVIIVLSIAACLFLILKFTNSLSGILRFVVIVVFMGIILNAWDCGTFANAIDRLGCKMIWLIPFMAILILIKVVDDRNVKAAM